LTGPRRITVITRQRCELCADLLELLGPYASAGAMQIEERDVDTDPGLLALHAWRVPVVLEGEAELLWGRIEPEEVLATFGPPVAPPPMQAP